MLLLFFCVYIFNWI